MRRSKRKHNNRTRRKHLDKLARAKLARWNEVFTAAWRSRNIRPDTVLWGVDPGNKRGSFSGSIIMPGVGGGEAGTNYGPFNDPYIPPPELAAVRIHIQALINTEKKRIRQEYLTTRTGKGQQDV